MHSQSLRLSALPLRDHSEPCHGSSLRCFSVASQGKSMPSQFYALLSQSSSPHCQCFALPSLRGSHLFVAHAVQRFAFPLHSNAFPLPFTATPLLAFAFIARLSHGDALPRLARARPSFSTHCRHNAKQRFSAAVTQLLHDLPVFVARALFAKTVFMKT